MSSLQPMWHPYIDEITKERDDALMQLERHKLGVTVCVPTFNEPYEVLDRALYSALDQTVKPLEIIVVDDGSSVPVKVDEHPLVRVVRITNRGLPSARNTGLMLAKGHAFLPLDADDWLHPEYIEKTLPLLEGVDVVLTGLQERGNPPRNQAYNPGFDRSYDQVDEEILWSYNRFYYASLFRTDVLRGIGGYHPAMAGWPGVHGGYEDWDVWITLKRANARFAAVNEPLLNYTTSKPDSMLARAESNRSALIEEMSRHHNR